MNDDELPLLLRWLVALASVFGSLTAIVVAYIALRTARAADTSASIARKEFEIGRRPFVCVEWEDIHANESPNGRLRLMAHGRIVEASGIPTTLHGARVRVRTPASSGDGGEFKDVPNASEVTLYRERLYSPVAAVATGRFNEGLALIEHWGVLFATVDVELAFSAHDRPSEKWTCSTLFFARRADDRKVVVTVRYVAPRQQHGLRTRQVLGLF